MQAVDRPEEPHYLRAAQRTLLMSRTDATIGIIHNGWQLKATFQQSVFGDIGWTLQAMRDQNDRKIWAKPCIYGITHLRDFKWLVSRDEVEWLEVRQRLPRLHKGRVTLSGGATTWRKLQEARQLDEQAGRPWADGLLADVLLLDSALVCASRLAQPSRPRRLINLHLVSLPRSALLSSRLTAVTSCLSFFRHGQSMASISRDHRVQYTDFIASSCMVHQRTSKDPLVSVATHIIRHSHARSPSIASDATK